MDQEMIKLGEMSDREQQIAHEITYMWIKKKTNKFIYRIESQISKSSILSIGSEGMEKSMKELNVLASLLLKLDWSIQPSELPPQGQWD